MVKNNQNPWLTIWRYPEKTISRLVSARQYKHQNLLTALIGVSFTLSVSMYLDDIDFLNKSIYLPFVTPIIVGLVGSVLYIHLGGALLTRISKMFKGSSKPEQVKLAIAWSSVPIIISILFWPLMPIIIFQLIGVISDISIMIGLAISMVFVVINRILHIYSFVILARMMSSINHFSKWKGLISTSIGISVLSFVPFIIYLLCTR